MTTPELIPQVPASATVSYRALLALGPARRIVYALVGACLTFGMAPLTVLFTVHHATGSYRVGGLAVAAFGLTAGVSAPFRGRLVDRRGMHHWLPAMAAAYASVLIALDLAERATGQVWALIALSGLVGIAAPPLFASARSLWPRSVEPAFVRRGYAITSLVSDVGQVAGPVLASALFLVAPWPALVVCAATALISAALIVTGPDAPARHARPQPMPKLRESRGLIGLLVVAILFGASIGLVQIAVPVLAGSWDDKWLAGPLLAAFAFGSVIGALWFGSRHWHRPVLDRFLLSVLVLGLLLAPVGLATGSVTLALLLIVAGLAYGPATVSVFESLDELAPGGGAEALTWVTTAEAAGWAAGSAVASLLVLDVAEWSPFLVASLILVVPVGSLVALRARRRPQPR